MSTVISFLLDRTGSMASIRDDVIGGFNSFLDEQKRGGDQFKFIVTQFDTQGIDRTVYADISEVPPLTLETYVPRAGTPLLDAIGKTIATTENEARRADDRVLFVIYTDGEENSSREFTKQAIKQLIEKKQGQGWEFLFLGVGMDAYHEAAQYGIPVGNTFSTNRASSNSTFAAVSDSVRNYTAGRADYKNSLQEEEDRQKVSSSTPS